MRLLILYNEVMPYNVIAYREAIKTNQEIEIHVICWDESKKLTPYQPPQIDGVKFFRESDFDYPTLKSFFINGNYDLLYTCGRQENKYLKLSRFSKKHGVPVIGQSDEQFLRTTRQFIKKLFSYYLYRQNFDFMMVPGMYQYEMMRFLGFKRNQILLGAYTADIDLFSKSIKIEKRSVNPSFKSLLYVGRLEPEKGLRLLIDSISEINRLGQVLLLEVVGNGSLENWICSKPWVTHTPFLEQKGLLEKIRNSDACILASTFEPWGVVLHEYAAAGKMLIASDKVGSVSSFLINNYNGLIFESGNYESLVRSLKKFCSYSTEDIELFGERSKILANSIHPTIWISNILTVIERSTSN